MTVAMDNRSDVEDDPSKPISELPVQEWEGPRAKARKRRRQRSSPEDIRKNKREKRKKPRKSAPEVIFLERKQGEKTQRNRRVQFGHGQLKRMSLPTKFSLLDDPEETIEFLSNLGIFSAAESIRHINFNGKDCKSIGLDALVVMSVLVMRAERRRKEQAGLTVSGTWPTDLSTQIMFKASGIPHHLGLKEAILTPEQEMLVHRCELYQGKAVRSRSAMGRHRNEA